jgi:hypothetical protein
MVGRRRPQKYIRFTFFRQKNIYRASEGVRRLNDEDNAEYFADISSANVASDFEYTTKIRSYEHRGGCGDRALLFIDHEGCANGMPFEELQHF